MFLLILGYQLLYELLPAHLCKEQCGLLQNLSEEGARVLGMEHSLSKQFILSMAFDSILVKKREKQLLNYLWFLLSTTTAN